MNDLMTDCMELKTKRDAIADSVDSAFCLTVTGEECDDFETDLNNNGYVIVAAENVLRLTAAVDYYRSWAINVPPGYVPKRIVLLEDITIRPAACPMELVCPAGEYECKVGRLGNVWITSAEGREFGVSLDQFRVLEWRKNDK